MDDIDHSSFTLKKILKELDDTNEIKLIPKFVFYGSTKEEFIKNNELRNIKYSFSKNKLEKLSQ